MEKKNTGIIVLNGWAASEHAWDLCGFMRTPAPNGKLPELVSYVSQLDGAAEAMLEKGGRHILVGWSMGGSSALRLACRYPDRIAGLVLVAATPRMMEDRESCWKGMSPRRLEALRKGLELTHGEGFFGVSEGKPNPYMMDRPENLERGLKYLLDTDVRADLKRVFADGCAFPVHIFQSEADGIVRSSNAYWLKEIFPHAELTVFGGSEHALPVFFPEAIECSLLDVLSRL